MMAKERLNEVIEDYGDFIKVNLTQLLLLWNDPKATFDDRFELWSIWKKNYSVASLLDLFDKNMFDQFLRVLNEVQDKESFFDLAMALDMHGVELNAYLVYLVFRVGTHYGKHITPQFIQDMYDFAGDNLGMILPQWREVNDKWVKEGVR